MRRKLLILGAGGHGKVVADIALSMDIYESISFLEDNPMVSVGNGLSILDTIENVKKYIDKYELFVAFGDNESRAAKMQECMNNGGKIATLIHPSVIISSNVVIGSGTVIMPGSIINCNSVIGQGCIINTATTVDHDNTIGDYVHLSPGVHLAGTVYIGNHSWLGIGSVVKNNISIADNCIIGAGAVVLKNIDEAGVYIGIPARLKHTRG